MLRKYGIGLVAVIAASAAVAFTAPKRSHLPATHVFEFDGVHNAYTTGNVTTPGNWKYVGETSSEPLCDDTPDKACRIAVTNAYVNNPSSPGALSGLSISAATIASGDAYVTAITDEAENMFSNQEE